MARPAITTPTDQRVRRHVQEGAADVDIVLPAHEQRGGARMMGFRSRDHHQRFPWTGAGSAMR